jgi:hypothetical protein
MRVMRFVPRARTRMRRISSPGGRSTLDRFDVRVH